MRKLYDAGYGAGVRAAEAKQHGPGDFYNVDGTPAWHEIARFCQHSRDRLREKERGFIDDMASRTVWLAPAAKQISPVNRSPPFVHCRPLLAIAAVASVAHLQKMPANSASLAC